MKGLELSEKYYLEAVRPIFERAAPDFVYSAALIGSGSEVLGFDDAMSTDHHWGPRLMVFHRPEDRELAGELSETLRHELPLEFYGFPTNYGEPNPEDKGTQLLETITEGPVNHKVEFYVLNEYLRGYLGWDGQAELKPQDWLSFPQQKLLTLTAGGVFHDALGLEELRDQLAYYPHDVWLYLLASGWMRIGQGEHLLGRAGYAGSEAGSALIGAGLVRDLMQLAFLIERRYAPYAKWFGMAFKQLECAEALEPVLWKALQAESWQARQEHLAKGYQQLARMHNQLGMTEKINEQAEGFFGRPFKVIWGEKIAETITAEIKAPAVKKLLDKPLIGGIDQFGNSTDFVEHAVWREGVKRLYDTSD